MAALDAAWAAKDAAAYAAPFAEDGEFIGSVGSILSGRAAFQAQHVLLFSGPFASTTQSLAVRRGQFLTGTIAIADLDTELSGFLGRPPGLRETEPGVFRARERWVAVKHGGGWQIVPSQRTPIPPAS